MYQRKTRDCYELEANYGYGDGWEYVLTEYEYQEIKERAKEYLENSDYPVRIVKRRKKIVA